MKKTTIVVALAVLTLLASSLMAQASTTTVTANVPEMRIVKILTSADDGSADFTSVSIPISIADLGNTETESLETVTPQGWLHWWSNTNFRLKCYRDSGTFPTSMKLWLAPDGLGTFEIPIGSGSAHQIMFQSTTGTTDSQVPLAWQIRGLSLSTPAGSYTTQVTFSLTSF